MENKTDVWRGEALRFRPSTPCLVFALAVACMMVSAQTTNPPAQPPDWEHPSGPYAVVMEEDPGIPDHTVYRPEDLAAFPRKDRLPVVAFSGPGCDSNGSAFRPFFTEVASYGFLLIANGPPEPKGGSGPNFPKIKPADLMASIDWAIAENNRKDGKYYQRIDAAKIAVMGQSCGGAQALAISNDPRIKTIVMWNSCSFQFLRGGGVPPGGGRHVPDVDKEWLAKLPVPIAYFMGGKRDMLYVPALSDIDLYEAAPLFRASTDLPLDAHAGSFREKNDGKFGVVGVAWMKWQLKGDPNAAKMFRGADCGLCSDPQVQILP
jgi:hypothetical protein